MLLSNVTNHIVLAINNRPKDKKRRRVAYVTIVCIDNNYHKNTTAHCLKQWAVFN
jgi:hypothetical protein